MHVSSVELVGFKHPISQDIQSKPTTFFSLDASERMKYNAFRSQRNNLEALVEKRQAKGREIREKELQEMFFDLIQPHLEQSGLEASRCSIGYGEEKETFVGTSDYVLFKNNIPFDVSLRVVYWFSTKDETLSCTSNISYSGEGPTAKSPQSHLVHDLLNKVVSEREQDGTNFPLVSFRGDFIYFASAVFAIPLMNAIADIIKKVGPIAMEELSILYSEYKRTTTYEETPNNSVRQRVFKEAYENKLETELIKAGLIDRN